jgi:hypothetical protein
MNDASERMGRRSTLADSPYAFPLVLHLVQTREELEQLSSDELHDRAMAVARHRADVRFFWRLLRALPAAEAASGHLDEAESDVQSLFARLNDLRRLQRPEIEEALRPLYVEYLTEHG